MSKAVFPEKPAVRPLAGTDYVLEEDFYFPAKVEKWDVVVHVMPGFRTDGASIPRWLWPVFGSPYDPDIMAAAIGHDAMYRGRIVPRADADAAFRRMMKANGVARWKRRRIWLGVRLFGWITWLRHTSESIAEARRHIELAFGGQNDFSPSGPPRNRLDRYKGLHRQHNDKPKKGKDKMKKLIITMFENGTLQLLALCAMIAALLAAAGCGSPGKLRDVDVKGMYVNGYTEVLAIGRGTVTSIPSDKEAFAAHYEEDTAWLSPSTKTHALDLFLVGTNTVGSSSQIVEAICKAFAEVAPTVSSNNSAVAKGGGTALTYLQNNHRETVAANAPKDASASAEPEPAAEAAEAPRPDVAEPAGTEPAETTADASREPASGADSPTK